MHPDMYRNARFNEFGTVDLEYNHPLFGWVPFTASPDDTEELGRELHFAVMKSGTVRPYSPPTAEDLRKSLPPLSRKRLLKGLLIIGITEDEVTSRLDNASDRIDWKETLEFNRLDPLLVEVAADFQLPPAQVDSLWVWASTL